MLDRDTLFEDLAANGLSSWLARLCPSLDEKLAPNVHGDLPKWREVLASLPPVERVAADLAGPVVTVGRGTLPAGDHDRVRGLLQELAPWRKGPFDIDGILIDAEWRSDLKWARLKDALTPLANRLVLDVGCGNGYYALRMLGMGARLVIGAEPMLLYLAQHAALRHFMTPQPLHILPLRLHELPASGVFDTAFSMGVLYHQREPAEHLASLECALKPGGELVLETLVLPGNIKQARTPKRYARMKNVWHLPTLPLLLEWLEHAGFRGARTIDVTITSTQEQRRTDWMHFDSLAEALDPQDAALTIEGWPAPRRALVICQADS